jgi:hypothetical protein
MRTGFISLLVSGLFAASPAHAVFIGNSQGGADFPQGPVSFADAVGSYTPGLVGSNPTIPNRGADNALGVPDYAGSVYCATQSGCPYVSLGDGGNIVLRFVNNLLTGSNSSDLDLWVFEVGPDVEDTFVDISQDGVNWHPVGKVFGSTSGIDIDAFGFSVDDFFGFVRLTDDTNADDQNGASVGADIDAVGAISTTVVPAPGALLLFATALAAVGSRVRRSRRQD